MKLLDPKKVLQARPWPKKSPTAQNVTQKSPIKKIIIIIIPEEFQTVFASWYILFDIKTRTLAFVFCKPQKSPYQKLSHKKSHYKISNPKKVLRSQISNPKKGFAQPCHLLSLIYLSTPSPPGKLTMGRVSVSADCVGMSGNLTFRWIAALLLLLDEFYSRCQCSLAKTDHDSSTIHVLHFRA